MIFNNKHKAFCITFLITGTMVMAMFNFHVLKHQDRIAEIFYEIEPEEILTEAQLIEQQEESSKAETNNAFNQNQKSQRYAQVLKRIAPPEDYVRPDLSNSEYSINKNTESLKKVAPIEEEELNSFSKVNEVLKKQLEEDANNVNSTVSYSLVNRKHRHLPIPIYLCEASGKIIINITVNASGKVTDVYYNNASNSTNECLIESALEYAKEAKFNSDASKNSQIGSITFHFEGKH